MSDQTITPAVHRAAANSEPFDLQQRALEAIEALAVQHKAVLSIQLEALKRRTGCPCQSCSDAVDEIVTDVATWSADINQLEGSLTLLRGINCRFPAPEPSQIEEMVELVNSPDDDDDGAERVTA